MPARYVLIDLCLSPSTARRDTNRHSTSPDAGTAFNLYVLQKDINLFWADLYVRCVDSASPFVKYC